MKREPTMTVGEFSFGNKKLPVTTGIFNFCSATDCPSRLLGLCEHPSICYAKKAERSYRKQVLPFRRRQADFWREVAPEAFAMEFQAVSGIVSRRHKVKIDSLRFSEAGDFSAQGDVEKFTEVARILKKAGINVYGYTARRDLNLKRLMKVATVNGSGFMASNNFIVVDEPTGRRPVCPGDCRVCRMCQETRGIEIEVIKH